MVELGRPRPNSGQSRPDPKSKCSGFCAGQALYFSNWIMIRTTSRTDAALINLVLKIESKLGLEWNLEPMRIESTNLGL